MKKELAREIRELAHKINQANPEELDELFTQMYQKLGLFFSSEPHDKVEFKKRSPWYL